MDVRNQKPAEREAELMQANREELKEKGHDRDAWPERNWAGNYTYRAQKLHRPTTIEQVQEIVAQLEDALSPFEARPHWGKVFHADAAAIAALYKRHSDFVRLQERLDPRGAFRNSWLKTRVLGDK